MKKKIKIPKWIILSLNVLSSILIVIIAIGSIEQNKTIVESFTENKFIQYFLYFLLFRVAYKLLSDATIKSKK